MNRFNILLTSLLIIFTCASHATAAETSGTKTATLISNSGEKIMIGKVVFTPTAKGTQAVFTVDPKVFEERFLAMRPFICLDGDKHSYCHFPYRSPQLITDSDLTDLEYQFMFLRKPRNSVSLDPNSGLYYELKKTANGFEGALREVDMTPIIVPEGNTTRPIKRENLFTSDPTGHWLPKLVIE
ncbi:MAG: hypothetical protein RL020_40 [Pseudomonadota bacterium]|jgi:hypothetical protein